jgi:hypothetical protein
MQYYDVDNSSCSEWPERAAGCKCDARLKLHDSIISSYSCVIECGP